MKNNGGWRTKKEGAFVQDEQRTMVDEEQGEKK